MTNLHIKSLIMPFTILCVLFNSFFLILPAIAEDGFENTNQPEQWQTLTGTARLFHMDAFNKDGKGEACYKLLLFTDEGNIVELEFDPSLDLKGSITILENQEMTVVGKYKSGDTREFVVRELQLEIPVEKIQRLAAAESRPWLAVLCLYPDKSNPLPSKSHFQSLLSDYNFPSVDHFMREISYNRANFQGTEVIGPYTLTLPYGRYNFDGPDEDAYPEFHMDIFMHDIIGKIGNDVDFTKFFGVFFITNYKLSCNLAPGYSCAFITGWEIHDNPYSTAVFGPWGYSHQTVFAHESIHSYGIIHSSGPYNEVYDSKWDIMSGSGTCGDSNYSSDSLMHEENGCLGIHTIAWHKFIAGWINPEQIFVTGSSGAGLVNIERLEYPALEVGNYLMADIHIPGSNFYTIEYRRQLGYDGVGAIPDNAVIIHSVNPERADRKAQVVDPDANGNPNDEGAMWLPGETFQSGDGVIVHVESMNNEAAVVSMSNKAGNPVYANSAYNGFEDGTIGAPWNTVAEAYASVIPSGTVMIQPGIYREIFRLTKPCKLQNYGSDTSVFIGE